VGIDPVRNQPRGRRRDADVAPFSPEGDAVADVVDEFVFLDPVLRPLRVERQLLPLLFRLGDGNKIRTGPTALHDLVGDPLVAKLEVASRFVERGVDDWILDHDLAHIVTFLACAFIVWSGSC